MPYPITRGMGDQGDGFPSALIISRGFDTASPSPVFLDSAYAPEARIVEVIFSVPVLADEATNPANYLITGAGGLSVFSGVKITDNIYRLTTSKQTPGQIYTIRASGIHDFFMNLI